MQLQCYSELFMIGIGKSVYMLSTAKLTVAVTETVTVMVAVAVSVTMYSLISVLQAVVL